MRLGTNKAYNRTCASRRLRSAYTNALKAKYILHVTMQSGNRFSRYVLSLIWDFTGGTHNFEGFAVHQFKWKMSRLMTKPTKWPMHQAKTQISLGICPVWSVFAVLMKKPWALNNLLSAQWRLIRLGGRVFAGCTGHSVGFVVMRLSCQRNEPEHNKTYKITWCSVWSTSFLSTWKSFKSSAAHKAHNTDSDQTGQIPMLIRVSAGRTYVLWFNL